MMRGEAKGKILVLRDAIFRAAHYGESVRSDLGRALCRDVHGRRRGMEHYDLQRL